MAATGQYVIAGLDQGDVLWRGPSDQNWRTVASNPGNTIWDVAIDPVDPTTAYYVRHSDGEVILRTRDRGASWQVLNGPTGHSQTLAVRPSDRYLLVGGSGTYYISPDFGATWIAPNGPGPTSPGDNRKIFLLPGTSSMVMGTD